MDEDKSLEVIVHRVQLLGPDEVIELGMLPIHIHSFWIGLRSDRLIITGERVAHLYGRHPETRNLLVQVIKTALDPEEIHRNRNDHEMAIFWRPLDADRRYFMRVAVWLPMRPDLSGSVISARKTRSEDYEREGRQGRMVWRKGT